MKIQDLQAVKELESKIDLIYQSIKTSRTAYGYYKEKDLVFLDDTFSFVLLPHNRIHFRNGSHYVADDLEYYFCVNGDFVQVDLDKNNKIVFTEDTKEADILTLQRFSMEQIDRVYDYLKLEQELNTKEFTKTTTKRIKI